MMPKVFDIKTEHAIGIIEACVGSQALLYLEGLCILLIHRVSDAFLHLN